MADRLEAEEGYRSHTYDDSQGHLTIGYGTNLEIGISKQEARFLLEYRLAASMDCFEKAWPPFSRQNKAVQLALTDAAYQLGCAGLTSFRRFLAALDGVAHVLRRQGGMPRRGGGAAVVPLVCRDAQPAGGTAHRGHQEGSK